MVFLQLLFFFCCFIIFYNYLGYACIALLFNAFRNKKATKSAKEAYQPSVSFIVAAYNEEDFIEKKLLNALQQDYPSDKIEYIFVTDGSSDDTTTIVQKFPQIRLMHQPARNGKSAAINRAVEAASNDILIFSDANTLLNREATKLIAQHYADAMVGGVAGEKKVMNPDGNGAGVGEGEGMYWKYESALKKIDSAFYSVVGAAGELFSLRRKLYTPLPSNVILDDFVLSLEVAQKGYRILYEPAAYAMELPSFSYKEEQKRKVRIAAGGFQAIGMLRPLLQFWKQPRLSFLYISHRVLRWAVTPFCLVLALFSNILLSIQNIGAFYHFTLGLQVFFYSLAFIAAVLPGRQPKLLKLPYYFTFMNISVIWGFFRFLRGKQSAVWEKAKRTQEAAV